MTRIAFVAIGSNLGDPFQQCQEAVRRMAAMPRTRVLATSRWYRTEATRAGAPVEGPDFTNGVVQIETSLSAEALLTHLREIESEMGRPLTRSRDSPRPIDLDILLFEDRVIQTPFLTVPHPRLEKRMFVLRPLCDIAPLAVHPISGRTMRELESVCEKEFPLRVERVEPMSL